MAEIDTDNLVPTESDMLVHMLRNTEKIVSPDKRWDYADHKGEKDDDLDELDEDVRNFNNKSKDSKRESDKKEDSVFKKRDDKDGESKHGDHKRHSESDRERHKHDKKHADPVTETEDTAATESVKENDDSDFKRLSKKEQMLLKLDMLRKLGELKQCGVHLSQNYNLDSDYDMMQYEYKLHHDIRSKQNSVQWMSHMMIGIIKGTEMFNDNYNPFDIKLAGLSDKIGSDMHNYYAVLGDIYEKYNQPGKQMAPEMRLLLMISGAALSMQVNKVMPGFGGASNAVKSEENLNELRQKAEADSNDKARDFVKKQHDAAAQKAADIKMIQEKELEHQRLKKMMDAKNSDTKNFKDNLLLSSEAPSRDTKGRTTKNKSTQGKTVSKTTVPTKQDQEEEELDEDPTQHLTHEEVERIRKMRFMNEQKHLAMLRQMAHEKSNVFRNNHAGQSQDEKRKTDLARQNAQLDNILDSINTKKTRYDKLEKVENPEKSTKRSTKDSTRESVGKSRQSDKSDDRSTATSASSVSINPKIDKIMKNTSDKAKKELTEFSDTDEKKKKLLKKEEPKRQTASDREPTDKKESKQTKPNKLKTTDNIVFDENIQNLLDTTGSDYDNLSVDEMSVGSKGNNKQTNEEESGSKKSEKVSVEKSDKSERSKREKELMDFGTISFGSKTKGTKRTLNIGKTK
jgi:hypothetical protein